MASHRLSIGALSTAQQWLARSARFDPSDGRTDLMRATCLRRRYQQDAWKEAVQSAERNGAPAELIRQERRLGLIQAGEMKDEQNELTELLEAGVSPDDACEVLVHGYLARRDASRAEMVLKAWVADRPNSAHAAYMRAVHLLWLGDGAGDLTRRIECRDQAETEFRGALAIEPRHEMARQALADMLEEDDRLAEALREYATLAANAPASDSAKLGVVRMLRSLGGLAQARLALDRLRPGPESSAGTAAETGQIELESGNYKEAQNWLRQIDLNRTSDVDALRAAATAFAVDGKTTVAERLFARLDGEHGNWVRTEELQLRLATGSRDPKAADELRRLSAKGAGLPASVPLGEDRPATSASELYSQHCSGCHGNNGDGNGRGARHLFPKPRDLRTENSRLASSVNGVASLDDVVAVIQRGMPGTSMRAYEELSPEQRVLLAQEVLRLHREGLREQLRNEDEEIDAAELERSVGLRTTPGKPVSVPAIGPGDPEAVARGKEQYFVLGCHKCHGQDGAGTGDTPCYDERGRTCPPRDLVHEPFKGGPEPESMYRRIVLGMPGTPHPACTSLPEDRLVDLVLYCRSLSREPKRVQTNHQRGVEASRRRFLSAPDGSSAR
jgi:mono/diheme cytochrome c family protein/predicted Zn-dependent protease